VTIVSDLKEIARADVRYLEAQNYYEGEKVKELFSNPKVAAKLGANAEKFYVNIAKRAVDAVLFKLEVLGFTVTTESGGEATQAATTFKTNVWDHNRIRQVFSDALEYAEEFGDSYQLTYDDLTPGSDGVDAIAYTPLGARLFYDAETERRKLRFVRTWLVRRDDSGDDKDTWYRRVTIVDATEVRQLVSTVQDSAIETDAHFEPFVDEDAPDAPDEELEPGQEPAGPGVVRHGYGGFPVFHLRTKRPYGFPEHKCLYGIQNLIVKDIATLAEGIDGFGIPFRWRTISSGDNLKPGRADVFGEDTVGSREKDRVKAEPGSLANLYDTDAVGQLLPASVNNLLDPLSMFMRLASVVSVTPLDYFDASAASASGESKKEHQQAYNAKCETRQFDFDTALVDALEFIANNILDLGGVLVRLIWKPVQERTPEEKHAQAKSAQEAGMPYEPAWVEAGYPAEEVATWQAPEDRPGAKAKVAVDVSTAAKNFGAAAQLGVIPSDGVSQLLQQIVTPTKQLEG